MTVFAVVELTLDELAQRPPLVRFARLTIVTLRAVRTAGALVEPTGRNPLHHTIAFEDATEAVARFCAIDSIVWANPYHDA